MSLQKLLMEVESYTENPNLDLIKQAYYYAKDCHQGQYRVSGEPFVSHPLNVAQIMAELELDVISIVGALLHDVVEDTEVTEEELEEKFGAEVTLLVSGVTKLSKIDFKSREEHQAESLRKMFLAMAKDIRVILIKLADRLHNMRTLQYLSKEKQKIKATETLEIYAPLAHRLGISRLKWELEDLSFRHLESKKYYELVNKVAKNREEREGYIEDAINQVNNKLLEVGIKAKIYGRPKHLYSIYQKMVKQDKEFREIYDLTALRVIVNSVKECYQVLGLIHDLWNPMPGRIKDYVAMPKSNMYQSLHTTVIGPKGEPLEIQIRTWEMHRTAEYGIAAHWRYKAGNQKEQDFEKKISWLRQLLEWQKDLHDAKEFMETLKIDLFEDEVFVFTPKGDVVSLPKGASPVDFAYNIHTEIGHNCVGAKVNEKMIPLEYKLKNGDIIEVITSANSGPSRDWLKFVKTSRAKSKIKRWFRDQRKEEVAAKGKEMLEARLNKEDVNLKEAEKNKKLKEIAEKIGATTVESLYAKIGYNKVSVLDIVKKLKPQKKTPSPKTELKKLKKRGSISNRARNKGVKVKGMDDLLVRISKCCNPVPGDRISGYITRGRGISVHRSDCPNLENLNDQEPERIIDVEWHVDQETSYEVEIEVEALNEHSLLNEVTAVISEAKINITSANARTTRDRLAYVKLSLQISSLEHMKDIINKLEAIEGVLSVQRANPA
ncbi:bifunctional (p)ppGpp synthetase/guanosine-3',5'-bis(diphosphate) 3'-pyrophosphohydrolase [Natroniella acetigena]|uniref:RelA/SpoT family protein n=1 Tax=Natroniella acetigena TaxID=52004 RepID=UPI002009F266|nr:bifunctional (p)ppGpp synthetase/guanosine-3',5'-bis(diphosphate) 3'-pyrophosphohydrolase [Natroniella acetigena]MCK8827562.1 bifunctional (p)ppGpp synthetase/guanosine-3',5'-bis(diphosphate) 3'-pyrophosphohydrolase [Natroniella acetigena]